MPKRSQPPTGSDGLPSKRSARRSPEPSTSGTRRPHYPNFNISTILPLLSVFHRISDLLGTGNSQRGNGRSSPDTEPEPSAPEMRMNSYTRLNSQTVNSKKFNHFKTANRYLIRLDAATDYEQALSDIAHECYNDLKTEVSKQKLTLRCVGVTVESPMLGPAGFGDFYRNANEFDPNSIVSTVSKLQQSATINNLLGAPFTIVLNALTFKAVGFNPNPGFTTDDGRVIVASRDRMCLLRAIALGIVQKVEREHPANVAQKLNSERHSKYSRKYLQPLIDHCHMKEVQIDDANLVLPILEAYLDQQYPDHGAWRIIVTTSQSIETPFEYPPLTKVYNKPKTNICLVLNENRNHVDLVWNHRVYFGRERLCFDCQRGFMTRVRHRCTARCLDCGGFRHTQHSDAEITCRECNKTFKYMDCYNTHLGGFCRIYKKCEKCTLYYSTKNGHICNQKFCKTCHKYHEKRGSCFIQKVKSPKDSPPSQKVVFDFEARQEDLSEFGGFDHCVNAASAINMCHVCMDKGELLNCTNCHSKQYYWSEADTPGIDPAAELLRFLKRLTPPGTMTTAISHYGGRYDIPLLIPHLLSDEEASRPKIIATGNTIYRLEIDGGGQFGTLVFIDNYRIVSSALAALPKTLGLPAEITERGKGYFPHGFNRRENYGKVLEHLPPIEEYWAGGFGEKDYRMFMAWYEENRNNNFDFNTELRRYCNNDVLILAHAVLRYRALDREMSGDPFVDVFHESCTLASSVIKELRRLHFPANEIPVIPHCGYRNGRNQSDMAVKMLEWLRINNNVFVQHKRCGGEKKLTAGGRSYFVDGYIEAEKKVIEINGCRYVCVCQSPKFSYHGCSFCYPERDCMMQISERTPRQLLQEFQTKKANLEAAGYTVEVHWECEIKKKLKTDRVMREFFDNCILAGSLNFKDAFQGGRTQPFRHYLKAGDGWRIIHVDFCSLYPTVLEKEFYPVGVPTLSSDERNNKPVCWTKPEDIPGKGIYKVRVECDDQLYLPVLPYKVDSSLIFPSCRTCAVKGARAGALVFDAKCKHSSEQRQFVSTVTHVELGLALSTGHYKVNYFFEAYEWEKWTDSYFKSYIRKYLKYKIAASGRPKGMTDEQFENFRNELPGRYGFELKTEEFVENPGMRTVAKLKLNSSWGKLAQRNDLPTLTVCKTPEEVDALFRQPGLEILGIECIKGRYLYVRHTTKDAYVKETAFGNIVLALYTTSYARCKLYGAMSEAVQKGCQIAYTDTDSLILAYKDEECPLKTGHFLGDLTDEHPGQEIEEFVCAGPKQYGLKMKDRQSEAPVYEIHLRGFALNHENSASINYTTFENVATKTRENLAANRSPPEPLTVPDKRLRPNVEGGVRTLPEGVKKYNPVLNKGFTRRDGPAIYPFGYNGRDM